MEALKGQQPGTRKYGLEEAIHPVQIAGFQRMTLGEKMAQVVQMYHRGIKLKMMGLRMQHPERSELASAAEGPSGPRQEPWIINPRADLAAALPPAAKGPSARYTRSGWQAIYI